MKGKLPNFSKKACKVRQTRRSTVFLFDPFIHMNLTQTAKLNLESLEEYKKMEWFTEAKKLMTGDSFGFEELVNDEPR